jgi:biofilm PGA synthesis N-glycosyltransferase PgaC
MNILAWLKGVLVEWWAAVLDEFRHVQSIDGFAAWVGEYALLFPAGMCVVWMVFALLYVVRRESRLPFDPALRLTVAVVIPARNEERGIVRTIESLLSQSYSALTIHVVSDASTDRTAALARQFESRGVIVHELTSRHGKSGALQHVLDRIDDDLYMVVDADTIAQPGSILAIVQQFADPHVAGVTGNPRIAECRNPLMAMQAMEYMGIIGLIKRADSFWGGLYTVSGAAACFRTRVLREVGGWSGASVTEDIELSWRMQKAGHELAYEPRAGFLIQAPATFKALYRQRTRWARGMLEVLRLHGNLLWTGNSALIPMAAQVLGTLLWMMFALATTAVWIVTTINAVATGAPVDHETALRVLGLTTGLFIAQTLIACIWENHHRPGLWKFVPMALLFPLYYWTVILPSFILGMRAATASRGESTAVWEPTARSA